MLPPRYPPSLEIAHLVVGAPSLLRRLGVMSTAFVFDSRRQIRGASLHACDVGLLVKRAECYDVPMARAAIVRGRWRKSLIS